MSHESHSKKLERLRGLRHVYVFLAPIRLPIYKQISYCSVVPKLVFPGDSSAYWEVQKTFSPQPIKLLVDTGAQITLVSLKWNKGTVLRQFLVA